MDSPRLGQAAYPGAFAPRWPGDWAGMFAYIIYSDVAYYNVYIYDMIWYMFLLMNIILIPFCYEFALLFSWIDFGLAKLPSFHHQASVSIFIWSVSFCSLLTGCELEVLHAGIPYIYIYMHKKIYTYWQHLTITIYYGKYEQHYIITQPRNKCVGSWKWDFVRGCK